MAYKKLTDLTEIDSVDNADLFEIVDTSDTTQDPAGSSRKVTVSTIREVFGVQEWGDIIGTLSNQTDLQNALNAKANTTALTAHIDDVANPHEVTKAQVGLGNVDNTTDLLKPISTATQTALDLKATLTSIQSSLDLADSAIQSADLATVATSGVYLDLTGKPTLGTASPLDSGTASGNVPVLDGAGKLNPSILPAIAVTETFVVASQVAMLALTAETGDVAIRTDLSKTFILSGDPTVLADWKEMLSPTDEVSSVFGRSGVVTAQTNDYTWAQINKTTSSLADITTKNISLLTNDSGFTTNVGTVTSVGTGTGLTGGAITGSGTIALNSASIASLALADTALQSETDTLASVTGRGATTSIQSTFSGGLLSGLGTALLPSYSFTGDTNTGMWSPTADTLAWSTGGVERMRINPTELSVVGNINISSADSYRINGQIIAQASTTLNNYFFGNSGNLSMTGNFNSAHGVNSLLSNTTGFQNSAQGAYALRYNTTGNLNSAQGVNALLLNTTGFQNSAQGVNTLYSNTTGKQNSAQGAYALYSNTTGDFNSAQGRSALYSNITGDFNSAQGVNALYSNTTGNLNSAQGVNALLLNTTGYQNSAQGVNAGRTITTGNSNTFVGFNAGNHASQKTDAVNSMALGNGAYTTLDNQVVIGNTSVTQTLLNGKVGIGTTGPEKKLEVSSLSAGGEVVNLRLTNTGTAVNTASALEFTNTTADVGSGKIAVKRTNSPVAGDNEMTFSTFSNGSMTEWMKIDTSGNVGIGTTTPSYKLDVNGTGRFTGALLGDSSITGDTIVKTGGTSSQFLKADGSVDSNTYITDLYTRVAGIPVGDDDGANTGGNGVFEVGSLWFDTITTDIYQATDVSTGAAVWNKIVKLNDSGNLEGIFVPRSDTETVIDGITLEDGELAVTNDTLEMRLGDGSTAGGNKVQCHYTEGPLFDLSGGDVVLNPTMTESAGSNVTDPEFGRLDYNLKVVAYKIISGSKVYYDTSAESPTESRTGGAGTYNMTASWDALAGADGYVILMKVNFYDSSFIIQNYNTHYKDVGSATSYDMYGYYAQSAGESGKWTSTGGSASFEGDTQSGNQTYYGEAIEVKGDINVTNGAYKANGEIVIAVTPDNGVQVGDVPVGPNAINMQTGTSSIGRYATGNPLSDENVSIGIGYDVFAGAEDIGIGGEITAYTTGTSPTVAMGTKLTNNELYTGGIILGRSIDVNANNVLGIGSNLKLHNPSSYVLGRNLSYENSAVVVGELVSEGISTENIIAMESGVFSTHVSNPSFAGGIELNGSTIIEDIKNGLGSNLISNPEMTSNTWTQPSGGWFHGAGSYSRSLSAQPLSPPSAVTPVVGKRYLLTYKAIAKNSYLTITCGGVTVDVMQDTTITGDSPIFKRSVTFTATSTANLVITPTDDGDFPSCSIYYCYLYEITDGELTTLGDVFVGGTKGYEEARISQDGIMFPNKTTTEKSAISTPDSGQVIFDTTLGKLCVYTGSAWETITSV